MNARERNLHNSNMRHSTRSNNKQILEDVWRSDTTTGVDTESMEHSPEDSSTSDMQRCTIWQDVGPIEHDPARSKIPLYEPRAPDNATEHIDSIRVDKPSGTKLHHAEGEEAGSGEDEAEEGHPEALVVDLGFRGDGGDEGLGDAVDGEKGDVEAVAGEDGAGAGGGPAGACEVLDERGCGEGADGDYDYAEEDVEA